MNGDPFTIARNAVANASVRAVSDLEIQAALVSGDGAGNIVRALFSDCSAETLLSMAHCAGVSPERLTAAYATAKRKHAAANEAMDAVVDGTLV